MSDEFKDGYRRMYFKKNKVWAELMPDGLDFAVNKGKVKIKYQLTQDQEYAVPTSALRTLAQGPDPAAEDAPKKAAPTPRSKPQPAALNAELNAPANAIIMFTDGASSGNPGPAGIGVYLQFGGHEKEISEYIGEATNNIAELTAILRGLAAIKNKKLPVRVLTDSQYVLGLLSLNWKARANQELVAQIKTLMQAFADLKFSKVKGHQGVYGNEKADKLATDAVKNAGRS